jgi:hypothetical protein
MTPACRPERHGPAAYRGRVSIAAGSTPDTGEPEPGDGPRGQSGAELVRAPTPLRAPAVTAGAGRLDLAGPGLATETRVVDLTHAVPSTASNVSTSTAAGVPAVHAGPRSLVALPGVSGPGLTGVGVVAAAVLLGAVALVPDLLIGDWAVGVCFSVAYLAVCVVAPLVARLRALSTVAVLPPLMWVAAVVVAARTSGTVHGSRELVLETGTQLALSAPVLFLGTALTLLLVTARALHHLATRRR